MLLLDENISHRIVVELEHTFPSTKHLKDFLPFGSDDELVWDIAVKHNLTIVTFDADYADILNLKGFPPKVVWLRFGNCTNKVMIQSLLHYSDVIIDFIKSDTLGILEIDQARY